MSHVFEFEGRVYEKIKALPTIEYSCNFESERLKKLDMLTLRPLLQNSIHNRT